MELAIQMSKEIRLKKVGALTASAIFIIVHILCLDSTYMDNGNFFF